MEREMYSRSMPEGNTPPEAIRVGRFPQPPGGGRGRGGGGDNPPNNNGNEGGVPPDAFAGRGREREDARTPVFWRDLKDPEIQRIAERVAIYFVTHADRFPPEDGKDILVDSIAEIKSLRAYINPDEADRVIGDIRKFQAGTFRPEHVQRDTVYIDTLKAEDLATIDVGVDGPIRWLEKKFNTIYETAMEGNELESQLIQSASQAVGIASTYIERNRGKTPEIIRKFGAEFSHRINLLLSRSRVEMRDIEGVIKANSTLRAHGLMSALSLEGGTVAAAYTHIQQVYDDMRLRETVKGPNGRRIFHITPEMNAKLQGKVEKEQMMLARQEIGPFGNIYRNERIAAESSIPDGPNQETLVKKREMVTNRVEERVQGAIRRSVRIAYDAFVVSQRQAVIVARSQPYGEGSSLDNYLSDPGALFATVYNQETILTGKYFIYNKIAKKFLDQIKLGIADDDLNTRNIDPKSVSETDRLDLGTRLIRDLGAVPDLWSSSWRIKQTLDQLSKVLGSEEKAKDFGLFLRLKAADDKNPDNETEKGWQGRNRSRIWSKIAEYKPEDVVKLFRERKPSAEELQRDEVLRNAYARYNELQNVFENNGIVLTAEDETQGRAYYDNFKVKYGSLILAIRETGFAKMVHNPDGSSSFAPEQVDFTNLNPDQIRIIENFKTDDGVALGVEGRTRLVNIFTAMKAFASNANVSGENGALLKSTRFEDIYTRTLSVEDVLLNKLENVENLPNGANLTALSKMWGSEPGGDSLVRGSTDTQKAIEGFMSFLKFIREEDPKLRLEEAGKFADAVSQYNGQDDKAKAVRFTIGTYLGLAKEGLIWDSLGIAKGPWRNAISKLQHIYGPQAESMSRDELRQQLDHYRYVLTGSTDTAESPAEKHYKALERLLEVDAKGINKRRAISFLMYIIFGLLVEASEVVDIKPGGGKH